MTIKEVCERTGMSPDTVRYYEKAGVIPNVNRSCGGTRCYSEEDLEWLRTAGCLRNAGMTVAAISRYVALYKQGDETTKARLELLEQEKSRMLEQKQQLEEALCFLDYKISKYEEALETGVLNWDDSESLCREEET